MVWVVVVFSMTVSMGIADAQTHVWADVAVPFNQTLRFSTTHTARIRVSIGEEMLAASDRLKLVYDLEKTTPWTHPYLIVNDNRSAFYYLGEGGVVHIRAAHLRSGENSLCFADQSTTGDTVFIYEMRIQLP